MEEDCFKFEFRHLTRKCLSWIHSTIGKIKPSYRCCEYDGSSHVIYNKSSNCAKPLTSLRTKIVVARCSKSNFFDTKLRAWSPRTRQLEFKQETAVKITRAFSYVYCFPGSITFSTSAYLCPPSVIRIRSGYGFNTSDISVEAHNLLLNISRTMPVMEWVGPDFDASTAQEICLIERSQTSASGPKGGTEH